MPNIAGFYLDPPIWVAAPPDGWPDYAEMPPAAPWEQKPFVAFREEVYRRALPLPVQMRIAREGLFSFDFSGWHPGESLPMGEGEPVDFGAMADVSLARTLVMNGFLAFLFTAIEQIDRRDDERMVMTPDLLLSMQSLEGLDGMGYGGTGVTHLAQSWFPSTYRPGLPYAMDDRVSHRRVLSLGAIERAADALNAFIADHGVDDLVLPDLFLRAGKAYQQHNYSLALITYWTIIERLLSERWEQYLAANAVRGEQPFVDRPRRKRLEDGRTFTAAVIAEMLSFGDYLSHDLYEKLVGVRRARNNWIHRLTPVSMVDARVAALACRELFYEVKGIILNPPSSLHLRGL